MGNGASDEDVMEEIEQYLHEYKLWEKKSRLCFSKSKKSTAARVQDVPMLCQADSSLSGMCTDLLPKKVKT